MRDGLCVQRCGDRLARLQRAGRGAAQKANSSDHLHHHGKPQPETASDDGSLWLVFGTDSGFEGITALYYTRLTVWLNRMDAPWIWIDRATTNGARRLIWNQGQLETSQDLSEWSPALVTNRPHLHLPGPGPHQFWRVRVN